MKKYVGFVSLFALMSAPSFAGSLYGFVEGGTSKIELDAGDGLSVSKSDTALGLGAGYKINKHFAVEGAYRDLGTINQKTEYDDEYRISGTSLQLSVVGSVPVSETFAFYGRVGFAHLNVDGKYIDCCNAAYNGSESETKNKAVYGIGGEYKFSETIGARLEYSKYAEWDGVTISATTVGLTYSF